MSGAEAEKTPLDVHDLQERGKAVVGAAGAVVSDRLKAEVDARSSRFAVELKAFAVAMRESTRSLEEQGHTTQADVVNDIAGRADRFAAHLVASSTEDLVEEGKDIAKQAAAFAKKEPVLVIAGAFTLGLLVPKLLEAVADES
jgi:hypothetical protein